MPRALPGSDPPRPTTRPAIACLGLVALAVAAAVPGDGRRAHDDPRRRRGHDPQRDRRSPRRAARACAWTTASTRRPPSPASSRPPARSPGCRAPRTRSARRASWAAGRSAWPTCWATGCSPPARAGSWWTTWAPSSAAPRGTTSPRRSPSSPGAVWAPRRPRRCTSTVPNAGGPAHRPRLGGARLAACARRRRLARARARAGAAAEWLAWPSETAYRLGGRRQRRAPGRTSAFGAGDQAAAWSRARAGSACAVLGNGPGAVPPRRVGRRLRGAVPLDLPDRQGLQGAGRRLQPASRCSARRARARSTPPPHRRGDRPGDPRRRARHPAPGGGRAGPAHPAARRRPAGPGGRARASPRRPSGPPRRPA